MYRKTDTQQAEPENVRPPFNGKLSPNNRWIRLAHSIPWNEFEDEYASQFAINSGQLAPAIPFRVALGAILIQEKLQMSNEETVAQIQETPHMQYLIGMSEFQSEAPFDPSLMAHFRNWIDSNLLKKIHEHIIAEAEQRT